MSTSRDTSASPPFKIVPRREPGEILLSSCFRVTIADRDIISNSRVVAREDVGRNPVLVLHLVPAVGTADELLDAVRRLRPDVMITGALSG